MPPPNLPKLPPPNSLISSTIIKCIIAKWITLIMEDGGCSLSFAKMTKGITTHPTKCRVDHPHNKFKLVGLQAG